jgi:hypothetical protein
VLHAEWCWQTPSGDGTGAVNAESQTARGVSDECCKRKHFSAAALAKNGL